MNGVASPIIESISGSWAAWMWAMTWQVAVAALVLVAIEWFLQRRAASLRYALWLLVLVRLVTAPDFAFPTGWGWWLRSSEPTVALVSDVDENVTSSKNSELAANTPTDDNPTRESNSVQADSYSSESSINSQLEDSDIGTSAPQQSRDASVTTASHSSV